MNVMRRRKRPGGDDVVNICHFAAAPTGLDGDQDVRRRRGGGGNDKKKQSLQQQQLEPRVVISNTDIRIAESYLRRDGGGGVGIKHGAAPVSTEAHGANDDVSSAMVPPPSIHASNSHRKLALRHSGKALSEKPLVLISTAPAKGISALRKRRERERNNTRKRPGGELHKAPLKSSSEDTSCASNIPTGITRTRQTLSAKASGLRTTTSECTLKDSSSSNRSRTALSIESVHNDSPVALVISDSCRKPVSSDELPASFECVGSHTEDQERPSTSVKKNATDCKRGEVSGEAKSGESPPECATNHVSSCVRTLTDNIEALEKHYLAVPGGKFPLLEKNIASVLRELADLCKNHPSVMQDCYAMACTLSSCKEHSSKLELCTRHKHLLSSHESHFEVRASDTGFDKRPPDTGALLESRLDQDVRNLTKAEGLSSAKTSGNLLNKSEVPETVVTDSSLKPLITVLKDLRGKLAKWDFCGSPGSHEPLKDSTVLSTSKLVREKQLTCSHCPEMSEAYNKRQSLVDAKDDKEPALSTLKCDTEFPSEESALVNKECAAKVPLDANVQLQATQASSAQCKLNSGSNKEVAGHTDPISSNLSNIVKSKKTIEKKNLQQVTKQSSPTVTKKNLSESVACRQLNSSVPNSANANKPEAACKKNCKLGPDDKQSAVTHCEKTNKAGLNSKQTMVTDSTAKNAAVTFDIKQFPIIDLGNIADLRNEIRSCFVLSECIDTEKDSNVKLKSEENSEARSSNNSVTSNPEKRSKLGSNEKQRAVTRCEKECDAEPSEKQSPVMKPAELSNLTQNAKQSAVGSFEKHSKPESNAKASAIVPLDKMSNVHMSAKHCLVTVLGSNSNSVQNTKHCAVSGPEKNVKQSPVVKASEKQSSTTKLGESSKLTQNTKPSAIICSDKNSKLGSNAKQSAVSPPDKKSNVQLTVKPSLVAKHEENSKLSQDVKQSATSNFEKNSKFGSTATKQSAVSKPEESSVSVQNAKQSFVTEKNAKLESNVTQSKNTPTVAKLSPLAKLEKNANLIQNIKPTTISKSEKNSKLENVTMPEKCNAQRSEKQTGLTKSGVSCKLPKSAKQSAVSNFEKKTCKLESVSKYSAVVTPEKKCATQLSTKLSPLAKPGQISNSKQNAKQHTSSHLENSKLGTDAEQSAITKPVINKNAQASTKEFPFTELGKNYNLIQNSNQCTVSSPEKNSKVGNHAEEVASTTPSIKSNTQAIAKQPPTTKAEENLNLVPSRKRLSVKKSSVELRENKSEVTESISSSNLVLNTKLPTVTIPANEEVTANQSQVKKSEPNLNLVGNAKQSAVTDPKVKSSVEVTKNKFSVKESEQNSSPTLNTEQSTVSRPKRNLKMVGINKTQSTVTNVEKESTVSLRETLLSTTSADIQSHNAVGSVMSSAICAPTVDIYSNNSATTSKSGNVINVCRSKQEDTLKFVFGRNTMPSTQSALVSHKKSARTSLSSQESSTKSNTGVQKSNVEQLSPSACLRDSLDNKIPSPSPQTQKLEVDHPSYASADSSKLKFAATKTDQPDEKLVKCKQSVDSLRECNNNNNDVQRQPDGCDSRTVSSCNPCVNLHNDPNQQKSDSAVLNSNSNQIINRPQDSDCTSICKSDKIGCEITMVSGCILHSDGNPCRDGSNENDGSDQLKLISAGDRYEVKKQSNTIQREVKKRSNTIQREVKKQSNTIQREVKKQSNMIQHEVNPDRTASSVKVNLGTGVSLPTLVVTSKYAGENDSNQLPHSSFTNNSSQNATPSHVVEQDSRLEPAIDNSVSDLPSDVDCSAKVQVGKCRVKPMPRSKKIAATRTQLCVNTSLSLNNSNLTRVRVLENRSPEIKTSCEAMSNDVAGRGSVSNSDSDEAKLKPADIYRLMLEARCRRPVVVLSRMSVADNKVVFKIPKVPQNTNSASGHASLLQRREKITDGELTSEKRSGCGATLSMNVSQNSSAVVVEEKKLRENANWKRRLRERKSERKRKHAPSSLSEAANPLVTSDSSLVHECLPLIAANNDAKKQASCANESKHEPLCDVTTPPVGSQHLTVQQRKPKCSPDTFAAVNSTDTSVRITKLNKPSKPSTKSKSISSQVTPSKYKDKVRCTTRKVDAELVSRRKLIRNLNVKRIHQKRKCIATLTTSQSYPKKPRLPQSVDDAIALHPTVGNCLTRVQRKWSARSLILQTDVPTGSCGIQQTPVDNLISPILEPTSSVPRSKRKVMEIDSNIQVNRKKCKMLADNDALLTHVEKHLSDLVDGKEPRVKATAQAATQVTLSGIKNSKRCSAEHIGFASLNSDGVICEKRLRERKQQHADKLSTKVSPIVKSCSTATTNKSSVKSDEALNCASDAVAKANAPNIDAKVTTPRRMNPFVVISYAEMLCARNLLMTIKGCQQTDSKQSITSNSNRSKTRSRNAPSAKSFKSCAMLACNTCPAVASSMPTCPAMHTPVIQKLLSGLRSLAFPSCKGMSLANAENVSLGQHHEASNVEDSSVNNEAPSMSVNEFISSKNVDCESPKDVTCVESNNPSVHETLPPTITDKSDSVMQDKEPCTTTPVCIDAPLNICTFDSQSSSNCATEMTPNEEVPASISITSDDKGAEFSSEKSTTNDADSSSCEACAMTTSFSSSIESCQNDDQGAVEDKLNPLNKVAVLEDVEAQNGSEEWATTLKTSNLYETGMDKVVFSDSSNLDDDIGPLDLSFVGRFDCSSGSGSRAPSPYKFSEDDRSETCAECRAPSMVITEATQEGKITGLESNEANEEIIKADADSKNSSEVCEERNEASENSDNVADKSNEGCNEMESCYLLPTKPLLNTDEESQQHGISTVDDSLNVSCSADKEALEVHVSSACDEQDVSAVDQCSNSLHFASNELKSPRSGATKELCDANLSTANNCGGVEARDQLVADVSTETDIQDTTDDAYRPADAALFESVTNDADGSVSATEEESVALDVDRFFATALLTNDVPVDEEAEEPAKELEDNSAELADDTELMRKTSCGAAVDKLIEDTLQIEGISGSNHSMLPEEDFPVSSLRSSRGDANTEALYTKHTIVRNEVCSEDGGSFLTSSGSQFVNNTVINNEGIDVEKLFATTLVESNSVKSDLTGSSSGNAVDFGVNTSSYAKASPDYVDTTMITDDEGGDDFDVDQLLATTSPESDGSIHQSDSPYANNGSPYVSNGSPYMNDGSPYASSVSSYANSGSSYTSTGSPYVNIGSPYVNNGSPYLNTGSPYVNSNSPYVNNRSPYVSAQTIASEQTNDDIDVDKLLAVSLPSDSASISNHASTPGIGLTDFSVNSSPSYVGSSVMTNEETNDDVNANNMLATTSPFNDPPLYRPAGSPETGLSDLPDESFVDGTMIADDNSSVYGEAQTLPESPGIGAPEMTTISSTLDSFDPVHISTASQTTNMLQLESGDMVFVMDSGSCSESQIYMNNNSPATPAAASPSVSTSGSTTRCTSTSTPVTLPSCVPSRPTAVVDPMPQNEAYTSQVMNTQNSVTRTPYKPTVPTAVHHDRNQAAYSMPGYNACSTNSNETNSYVPLPSNYVVPVYTPNATVPVNIPVQAWPTCVPNLPANLMSSMLPQQGPIQFQNVMSGNTLTCESQWNIANSNQAAANIATNTGTVPYMSQNASHPMLIGVPFSNDPQQFHVFAAQPNISNVVTSRNCGTPMAVTPPSHTPTYTQLQPLLPTSSVMCETQNSALTNSYANPYMTPHMSDNGVQHPAVFGMPFNSDPHQVHIFSTQSQVPNLVGTSNNSGISCNMMLTSSSCSLTEVPQTVISTTSCGITSSTLQNTSVNIPYNMPNTEVANSYYQNGVLFPDDIPQHEITIADGMEQNSSNLCTPSEQAFMGPPYTIQCPSQKYIFPEETDSSVHMVPRNVGSWLPKRPREDKLSSTSAPTNWRNVNSAQHSCPECGKVYAYAANVQRHINIVHKPFEARRSERAKKT